MEWRAAPRPASHSTGRYRRIRWKSWRVCEEDGERGGEKRARRCEERDRRERREQSPERCHLCSQDPKVKLGKVLVDDEDEEYMEWDDINEEKVSRCLCLTGESLMTIMSVQS